MEKGATTIGSGGGIGLKGALDPGIALKAAHETAIPRPHAAAITYQPAIDGLRAIAVLSVILYHYGLTLVPGGFVGVDIFFVISGYLISSIIRTELEQGHFSLLQFFERRARRILPALFLVIVASGIVSAVIMMPVDFRNFGQSVVATSLFVSNLLFWHLEFSYFDIYAQSKPLLHTWSLGIEEQFYIFFPLLALALGFRRRGLAVFGAIALASLAVSQYEATAQPSSAFYLIQSRAWELLVGMFCGVSQRHLVIGDRLSRLLQWLGLALIVLGLGLYGPRTPFPGLAGLLPVLGAAFVIRGCVVGDGLVFGFLSLGPLRWIGRISYSLYLWHWPVLVLVKYMLVTPPTAGELIACLAFTALAAWISYTVVESRFRRPGIVSRRALAAFCGTSIAALCAIGLFIHVDEGVPSRLAGYQPPPIDAALAAEDAALDNRCFFEPMVTGDTWRPANCAVTQGKGTAILWGDSFAKHYVAGLRAQNARFDATTYLLSHSSCPPILGFTRFRDPTCARFIDFAEKQVAALHPDVLIIAANWENYYQERDVDDMFDGLAKTIAYFRQHGQKLIVIGQSPVFSFMNPYDYYYRTRRQSGVAPAAPPVIYGADFVSMLGRATASPDFYDPAAVLCREGTCNLERDSQFITVDGGHFTAKISSLEVRTLFDQACRDHWGISAIRCDTTIR